MTDILFGTRLHLKKHEVGLKRNEILAQKDQEWFDKAIRSLKAGYPVQYITGHAEFYGLVLDVTPDVLIPRPETEELVRWIIDGIPHASPMIMDIGTGSGCIALALKKHIPGSHVMATDVRCGSTCVWPQRMHSKLEIELQFLQHDILSADPPEDCPWVDIIVSNPPYIPEGEKMTMATHVTAHEPPGALFVPDEDPIALLYIHCLFRPSAIKGRRTIIPGSPRKIRKESHRSAAGTGIPPDWNLRKDINGKDRMIKAIRS